MIKIIHYVTASRGTTYHRYAVYGGTHQEAEAHTLNLNPCGVVVAATGECHVRTTPLGDGPCARSGPLAPHGADGCTCAPIDGQPETWRLADGCTYHGVVSGPSVRYSVDHSSEPRLIGTGYRTTTEKRGSVVQPTGSGADGDRIDLAWIVRCQALARRLVRALDRRPRQRP